MAGLGHMMSAGSRALSYLLGALVLTMAAAVLTTARPAGSIIAHALGVFGITFIALLASLVFLCFLAWVRMRDPDGNHDFWCQLGMHAANGIATLALTYTLFGISLGIGSLSEQELTPDTIQSVISGLTQHFSMAFMTTVIGLPLAAIGRALIGLTAARPG